METLKFLKKRKCQEILFMGLLKYYQFFFGAEAGTSRALTQSWGQGASLLGESLQLCACHSPLIPLKHPIASALDALLPEWGCGPCIINLHSGEVVGSARPAGQ